MRISICAVYVSYDIQYVERAVAAMRANPVLAPVVPASLTICESVYVQYMRCMTYST